MRASADLGHPLSLRNVLPEAEFLGAEDIPVAACACDSRRVHPGTVFVALPRTNCDGHGFVAEAIARGCSGIIAERPVMEPGAPVCYVSDAREAYGRVCQAVAGNPSRRLKVIAVGGTGGKTTTACLVASILTTAGHTVGILGSLGGFDGREVDKTSCTTPPAHELATWLARMVDNGCTHAVMEVSGVALEQRRVAGIALDAACMTGLRVDRTLGERSDWDRELRQSQLFRHLTAEGFAVVNADDPAAASYLRLIDGPVLTVAMVAQAEITATFLERHASEQTILLSAGSDVVPVRTRMIGRPHVYHCLTAAAAGLAYGIDLPVVVRGLEAIDYVPGQLERIECGQPFAVFVDSARTPEALAARLQTLRELVEGRLICVFGAGGEREQGKRPRMGRAAEAHADLVVITDDNPRSEDPQAIIEDILNGLKCPAEAEVIPDRAEAIAWALSQARPGDCVLLAGKGHETCHIVGRRRCEFDDRQFAREWLYANQPHEIPLASQQ